MSERTTLRSIAKLANVSHMTVSLALRGAPSIPADTREKIQAIADRLGYRTDPIVAKVMSDLRFAKDGSRTLAFLTRFPDASWKKHQTFGQVFQGASARAQELGYKLEEFRMNEPMMTARRLEHILHTRAIPGAIIAATPAARGHNSMKFDNLSAVALGFSIVRPQFHRVANHQIHTLLLAMRRMRHYGNTRIGAVLLASTDERSDYNWTAGVSIFHKSLPPAQRVPMHSPKEWELGNFSKWLSKNRVDAIVGMGPHLLEWVKKLGHRVPEDVQVAALDLPPGGESHTAGVDQRHSLAGAAALDLLLGQMYLNERGVPAVPRTVLIEGQWLDGPTAARRARS